MDAPDREHVLGVAAADVYDILLEQEALDVVEGPHEQGEVSRLGSSGEGGVERGDVGGQIAAGRGQEADARPIAAAVGTGEVEDVVVEQRVVGLHREAAAAHRDDDRLRLRGHCEATRKPMCLSP